MNIAELKARIAAGENLHTEFKQRLDATDELSKDIVCFANTDGGQLLIGVDDGGTVVGVPNADEVNRIVDNVAYNNCEPPVTVVQEVLEENGKKIVVVNVPKGGQRPYRTNRGRYFTRTSSGCRDASREELLRLFQAAESLFYDETPLLRLTPADLDFGALERYLIETGQADLLADRTILLKNWGLMAAAHPTVAGLLLFGYDPQRHIPFAQVNAARIPGVDVSVEPSDRKDISGRMLTIIEDVQRFLRLHLPVPHKIKGFEPEPRPEIPEEALREAVVNGVAHRDYTVQGPIRIFILDDRIEFHTPGKPPNTVDAEAMRAGVHIVRNPRIYARLSDAGLVTRAGTGIRRMSRLIREHVGRDIDIQVRAHEVLLTLPRRLV
jgi:ATP-dependent DNA helicase RecG